MIGRLQPNAISSLMTSSPLRHSYGDALLQPTVSASASLQFRLPRVRGSVRGGYLSHVVGRFGDRFEFAPVDKSLPRALMAFSSSVLALSFRARGRNWQVRADSSNAEFCVHTCGALIGFPGERCPEVRSMLDIMRPAGIRTDAIPVLSVWEAFDFDSGFGERLLALACHAA